MATNISRYLHPSGTSLGYSTVSVSGPFTVVDDLNTVDPPEIKKGRAQATSVSSALKQMAKKPGWQDPGELKFTVYRTNGVQFAAFLTFYSAETVLWFNVQTSDGQTNVFKGFFSNVKPLGSIARDSDELLLDEWTVAITDDTPTFTTA